MARRKPVITMTATPIPEPSTPIPDPTPVKPSRVRIPTPTPPPPPTSTPRLVCTKCTNFIPEGVKFCPECGTAVPVPDPTPTLAPVPDPTKRIADLERSVSLLHAEIDALRIEVSGIGPVLAKLAETSTPYLDPDTLGFPAPTPTPAPDALDKVLAWLNKKVV